MHLTDVGHEIGLAASGSLEELGQAAQQLVVRHSFDRGLSCTVIVLLVVAPAAGPSTVAAPEPSQLSDGMNRYERRFGEPRDYSLDENRDTWPEEQSIRVVGILSPGFRSTARTYHIASKDGRYDLQLTPVQEIASRAARDAPEWLGREVEVVGAFPRRSAADIADGVPARSTFLIWSMAVLPEGKKDGLGAPRATLEALVWDLEAAAGRQVTVTGTYRGGNLLEDLPEDSRRDPEDWVLNDGPFSIWVTGRKPEGKGFSLDLRSQADLRWELAVQGEVEIHDGFIYLRAERVHLVGPAKPDADSR